jgi:uroporphyrin-III C-methyltransferase/precorrin-2 dehydrogenase/sirohydrochlorin ferrochelatase
MEPIAVLPVFFKLAGKRAVLAGGTAPAVWKAELLAAAGARVDIFADDLCDAFKALLADPPGAGALRVTHRAWEPGDLAGAAIAIGAIEEVAEAEAFRQAARLHGVPVNVIDRPAFCDFQFGTIVSRSPLVIGLSTDGAAPVFGQALRARIEALLPQGLKAWAEAARDWRPAVQALGLDFRGRRRFWEVFAERALACPDQAPATADREACLAAIEPADGLRGHAEVMLVGAGPGDPDAVTLRAIRALQSADVVLYATGVSPTIVGFARREALKIALSGTVDDDAATARAQADDGLRVVWLDKGDPERCDLWRERAGRVADGTLRVTRIAGLGRCDACAPSCPGWAAGSTR